MWLCQMKSNSVSSCGGTQYLRTSGQVSVRYPSERHGLGGHTSIHAKTEAKMSLPSSFWRNPELRVNSTSVGLLELPRSVLAPSRHGQSSASQAKFGPLYTLPPSPCMAQCSTAMSRSIRLRILGWALYYIHVCVVKYLYVS